MPSSSKKLQLDKIFAIITNHTGGVDASEIQASLSTPILARTFQRRLQDLISSGLITREGSGKASRYYPTEARATSTSKTTTNDYIPLSLAGEKVHQRIYRALSERKRVNYNPDFLHNYTPNQTYYLSEERRQHLEAMGEMANSPESGATFVRSILDRLLIDLSWNSSRLEGNTYSLLDTERLIERGRVAEGKDLFESRMILNHKAAIEFLVEMVDDINFSPYIIFSLHALLSKRLLGDPSASGQLRSIPVSIGRTAYQPVTIPQLIEEYFQQILSTANKIKNPFEQSFFAMVHLPYLQPFVDVNKRVSRLAANIPLIKNDLCPISFIDVPKQAYIDGTLAVYEFNDVDLLADVYMWAYERSTVRYTEARHYLIEPDIVSERYDTLIREVITLVITEKQSKSESVVSINHYAEENISEKDRSRFIEIVQTELTSLHEGNIAMYKIKPDAFRAWQKFWLGTP